MTNEFREAALEVVVPVLQKHSVDFMIIGGTAVNIYGHQRISGGSSGDKFAVDLDFCFNPNLSNYHDLVKALKDLKVDTRDLKEVHLTLTRLF